VTGLPAVGETAPERAYGPLTTEMFVRYSGASGDLNPMHYDKDFAVKAGYPSVFSQGMHTASLLASFAIDWLGAERLRRIRVRFRTIVFPGDVLTCTGRVTSTSGALATVELVATRQDGSVAIQGEADFTFDE